MEFTDRLGNDLNIGDLCICFVNMRTGSSTTRLVQFEGEIVGFTKKLIKVKCVDCVYGRTGKEYRCYPNYIFKANNGQK